MSAGENVGFGLKMRNIGKEECDQRVREALDLVQLGGLAARRPLELSGGQRQRVALARALVIRPAVLLLDEPLSNLDANLREEMRFEVRRLHDQYRYTTVYVTHDQAEAMTTADVIAVMNAGRIEQAGSPEDIYDRPRSEFVARFIGMSNVVKGKALDASHIELAGLPLRATGGALKSGSQGAVSIRQHDIVLSAGRPQASENVIPAKVLRHVFLGGSRDYMVEVADGTQLRVITPAAQSIAAGDAVFLHLPPDKCRALAD
jgi:iron(III) transport system ATP-binding protein